MNDGLGGAHNTRTLLQGARSDRDELVTEYHPPLCPHCEQSVNDLISFMNGEVKHDALHAAAITGIASDLEKHCVAAIAKVRSIDSSLSALQEEIKPASVTLTQDTVSLDVDTRNLPAFSDLKTIFANAEVETGNSVTLAKDRWKKLAAVAAVTFGKKVSSSDSFGDRSDVASLSPVALDNAPTRTDKAPSFSTQRRALDVTDAENSLDQQQDDQMFNSILAAQTVTASVTFTEESRRIESGQKASLALRPNVVLLKLAPPPVSVPRFGSDGWLHTEGDLVINRTYRPSDANGNKLSEEQYYKYVNIDPSTLDAHVRACYRVYFGEQVSVSRPSGRKVPSGSDVEPCAEICDADHDVLAWARSQARKSFLPYSSWQKNSYVNLETTMNSNDPFETTRSDPRTRLLIQFQSLQMKLLEHPDFRGVEPLFATAFIYSTGKNVGRRVSEMVHFDLNSQDMLLSVLQPHLFAIDPLSRCTNMLFNLSKQSQDLFLVVIVERLYGSDDNSVYVSPGKIHKNSKARAELVQRFAKNASKYFYSRRPFAWTAHRLFETSQSDDKLQLVEGPVTLDQFWTISNDALKPFDLLSAILQKFPSSLAKAQHSSHSMGHEMQKMEGSLTFCVQEWRWFCKTKIRSQKQPATAVTLFDSTRSGMTHSDPSVSIFDSMHVVEVVELDSMARLSYSTFNNFVFVAPIAINLSSYDKFGAFHEPSVMVSACICERAQATASAVPASVSPSGIDQYTFVEGLQCCIGKSSVPSLVSCSVNSHVAEFTKFPLFHDVLKMTLKPRIAPGTHVLFTVYDVNSKSGHVLSKVSQTLFKHSDVRPLKQVIGYAFTSIDGGVSNPASDLDLPLFRELPADYTSLTPEALEQYRILPSEFPLHVSLNYQSTIQPKHPQLIQFFREYSSFIRIMDLFGSLKKRDTNVSIESVDMTLLQTTKRIEDSLSALTGSPNEALHHYFPTLCNQILCIVSGSLQILSYESVKIDADDPSRRHSGLPIVVKVDDQKSEYTALEESYFLKSTLYRQRVFSELHPGSGMWLTLADTAFQSLAGIFTQIERSHSMGSTAASSSSSSMMLPGERSIMKRTYVEDVFDNLNNDYGIVGFYVILAWQTNLQTRSNADLALNDMELHIGVLLDIIYKSYSLCFQKQLSSFPSDECPHSLEHGPYILQLIDSLMIQLSQKYTNFRTSEPERTAELRTVKDSICEIVIFVRDCARIFGSRCSFRFFHSILKHIYSLEDEVMCRVDFYFGSDFYNLRLEVIRIFMDSQYFVPMCRIDEINPMLCVDFDSALSQCPFTALLLTQLDEVTAKGFKKECAALGLAVMFHVLSSFDDNCRLQCTDIREKIAVMFWPFVRICLRFVHNMISQTLSSESWHYLLSCFIFVVGNLPDGFLSQWCSTQSFRIISYFVQILHRAVKEFSIDTRMLVHQEKDREASAGSNHSRSSYFIARSESVKLISERRKEGAQTHNRYNTFSSPSKRTTLNFEDSPKSTSTCHVSCVEEVIVGVSCNGEMLYETTLVENHGQHKFQTLVVRHFSDQFSTQMVLSVLTSLHDVLEQITKKVNESRSLDTMREDIDFVRLEDSVNDLFVTCLSRPYCRTGSSSQFIFTFAANFKVWSDCLPLVSRCFAMWSTTLPLKTKQWQEFFYHISNLKITQYEGLPAHEEIIRCLEETLIRRVLSQDIHPLAIQDVEDNTDEKSSTVNKIVKIIENGKQLLAATEEKIIDALVSREAEFGANFKEVFFCGFRNFITPMRLLCYLMGCVEHAIHQMTAFPADGIAGRSWTQSLTTIPRVMNLLKYWITTYGSDWDEHLLAAVHVLLERCTDQAVEAVPFANIDVEVTKPGSINSVHLIPKRVSSFRHPIIAEDASEPACREAPNQTEEPSPSSFVASGSSTMVGSVVGNPAPSVVTSANQRSSHEIVVSTFQVFVRAMIKHLKSSSRMEPDPSGDAFEALQSKAVKPQTHARSNVFQFFRQNIDSGDLFLMTSPKHWAQCLTLHSFHIFRRFQPQEFFRQPFPAWQVKPDSLKKLLVPNISANTEFFNQVKDFLVGCIFRADIASSARKRTLMHVIDIAYFMKQLNNFDGMFSSMSALDSVGVYRLKKLWSSVSNPEYEAKLADLHFLMESRNKYENYTAALRSASPPKLPYVGHFLGSLFMQSERHPKIITKQDVPLVNFGRYYGLHDVVFNDILVHRATPYSFSGPDDISKETATDLLAFVKAPHTWLLSSDEEYERSHRDEPCERVDCPVCSLNRVGREPSVGLRSIMGFI